MFIFLILGLLLGALIIISAFQNTETVTVMFLSWQFEGSLALVIILAIASGIAICLLFSLPEVIRKRLVISELKKRKDKLEDTLIATKTEVESEKSKAAATNAYLDELENKTKI